LLVAATTEGTEHQICVRSAALFPAAASRFFSLGSIKPSECWSEALVCQKSINLQSTIKESFVATSSFFKQRRLQSCFEVEVAVWASDFAGAKEETTNQNHRLRRKMRFKTDKPSFWRFEIPLSIHRPRRRHH
jgi:hypothetical protein